MGFSSLLKHKDSAKAQLSLPSGHQQRAHSPTRKQQQCSGHHHKSSSRSKSHSPVRSKCHSPTSKSKLHSKDINEIYKFVQTMQRTESGEIALKELVQDGTGKGHHRPTKCICIEEDCDGCDQNKKRISDLSMLSDFSE